MSVFEPNTYRGTVDNFLVYIYDVLNYPYTSVYGSVRILFDEQPNNSPHFQWYLCFWDANGYTLDVLPPVDKDELYRFDLFPF